ncbi:hypothetical protein [Actinacidiphila bryophytorum]|jgi:hypothetical protein|uniref:hypothetical protein n=1 Tax=Actinacidiphila bryophytorum TaxID=1436133 RepID=UPI002176D471|nr:hypothetical protein [Actinacidiphila bryophytorum]UWE12366.1 hypothetical protein NYE86_29235 [Actinacidiphila bryophytorum]
MQGLTTAGRVRRALAAAGALTAACGLVMTAAGPGYADTTTSKDTSGGSGNGTLTASVHYTTVSGSGKSTATVPLGSSDVTWEPPPCWIGPIGDPETFKRNLLKGVADTNVPGQANYALEAMDELRRHYEEGLAWSNSGEAYTNFNLDKQGKGLFWGPVVNEQSTSVHKYDCNGTLPFWVDNGKLPPPGTDHVITPEMLSRLAYARTQVPGVTVVTSPAATQTVNLPTWVRLTQDYDRVQVRASVDIGGGQQIWAQTSAEPAPVHIDPGTQDATLYPASGDCPVAADGTVGKAYNGDPGALPPCGMTYRRSSAATGPYRLDVTATWHVSWTGSDGSGGNLPDGVVHNPPQDLTVREIQSVNR